MKHQDIADLIEQHCPTEQGDSNKILNHRKLAAKVSSPPVANNPPIEEHSAHKKILLRFVRPNSGQILNEKQPEDTTQERDAISSRLDSADKSLISEGAQLALRKKLMKVEELQKELNQLTPRIEKIEAQLLSQPKGESTPGTEAPDKSDMDLHTTLKDTHNNFEAIETELQNSNDKLQILLQQTSKLETRIKYLEFFFLIFCTVITVFSICTKAYVNLQVKHFGWIGIAIWFKCE